MISRDHDRDSEERRGRIVGSFENESDQSASETGEGAGLQENVLIQDAAAQHLHGHEKDVSGDAEDERGGEDANDPGRIAGERSFALEGKQADSQDAEAPGADGCRQQPARPQHEEDKGG